MGVSKNSGTPKSSMLIGFSIISHPFWDTPILETPNIFFVSFLVLPLYLTIMPQNAPMDQGSVLRGFCSLPC